MKKTITLLTIVSALMMLNMQALGQYTYFQSGSLNKSSADVGESWTKLGTGTFTFTTTQNESQVEVILNSRFKASNFNDASGLGLIIVIDDDIKADFSGNGSLLRPVPTDFISMFAVFENLPKGEHSVSVWARAIGGTVNGVTVDPGGWGARIIVKVYENTAVNASENRMAYDRLAVQQNYPNPFSQETTIRYEVQFPTHVVLNIYDINGRLIKTLVDERKLPGEYTVKWNSRDEFGKTVSSGSYFYRLRVGDFVSAKKMIVLSH